MNVMYFLIVHTGCTSNDTASHEHSQCTNLFPVDGSDQTENHGNHGHDDNHSSDGADTDFVIGPFLPPREAVLPELLSETPLYTDIISKSVHQAFLHYTPAYQLWSDGEDKEREESPDDRPSRNHRQILTIRLRVWI